MSRRRRLHNPGPEAPAGTEAPAKPSSPGRATMRVEVEGDPDTVRNKMGMGADAGKGSDK